MTNSPTPDAPVLPETVAATVPPRRAGRGSWLLGPALGAVSLVVTALVHQSQRTTPDPWGYSLPIYALGGAVAFLLVDTVTSFILHRNRVRTGHPRTLKAVAVVVLGSLAWPPALFFAVASRDHNPPLWTLTGTPHTRALEKVAAAVDTLPAPGEGESSDMRNSTSYPADNPEDEVEIAFSKVFSGGVPGADAATPDAAALTYEDLMAWMNSPAWKEGDLAAALGEQGKVLCYPYGEGHAERPDLIAKGSPECEMQFFPADVPEKVQRNYILDDREFFVNAALSLNDGLRSSIVVRVAYEANP